MIYLDYTATTPVDEEVLEIYNKTTKQFCNLTLLYKTLFNSNNHVY